MLAPDESAVTAESAPKATDKAADHDAYEFSDDRARIDRPALVAFLTEQVYWGRWRGEPEITAQFDSAWRVVGVYHRESGRMVGFARAVSDGLAIAYLADVFVDPEHRGAGLGMALVRAMIDDGPGADFRWMLHTDTAHDLYRKFGFAEPDYKYMERPAKDRKHRA